MTPGFKFFLAALLAIVLAAAAVKARACTGEYEDPADSGWTIRCEITEV